MTLHLSELRLDPKNGLAALDLGNRYLMHQTLSTFRMDAFAPDSAARIAENPAPEDRVLWRQEDARVLVQSHFQPDFTRLQDEGYLLPDGHRSTPLNLQFQAGQGFRFRLEANVTVRKIGEDGRSRRCSVHTVDGQLDWLKRQGERLGFQAWADVTGVESVRCLKKGNGGGRMVFNSVRFDGELEVTAPALFEEMFGQGMGHAKSLGFGLLSLGRR